MSPTRNASIPTKNVRHHVCARLLWLCLALSPHGHATDRAFEGVIGRTEADSRPHWPDEPKAGKNAPNVLIWLMDDVGFGHASSFGGMIETTTMDKLAADGLRFTNFHSTPLCSPTRASLLTGRNPHNAGVGAHAGTASGYPGYNARIPKSVGGIGQILNDQGYATYAVGKWDQLPMEHASVAGPFDYWPSGQGFDHFYGFLHFDANHFDPTLWDNHSPVLQPAERAEDYHLTTDLADRAIDYINQLNAVDPHKPFLLYWSTGAVHAPHHAPQSYIDKYTGRFDRGWHWARETILHNQIAAGIVPADAELPDWPTSVPIWDDLSDDQQRMAARQMEAFAGMLDHADDQFGRILSALEAIGELENTIVLVISDNGASAEGGLAGTYNEATLGGATWAENLKFFEQWGGPNTYPHYAVGWAAAGNTPFKYYKQSAFEGGHRVPMIISWKRRIRSTGGLRPQFHHVSDIVPTVLDLAAIGPPAMINGVEQAPMDGISFRYALEDATAPTKKDAQYFELWGNRGIWADGWKANIQLRPTPWNPYARPQVDSAEWALYHVNTDFNERINLAASHQEKLEEMKALFQREAHRNQVYPLMPDSFAALAKKHREWLRSRDYRFVYGADAVRIPLSLAPPLYSASFEAVAELELTASDQSAVLFSYGGDDGGFALYLKDGVLVFMYNERGLTRHVLRAAGKLREGPIAVSLKVNRDHQRADIRLQVDGETIAEGTFDSIAPGAVHETFDVGADYGSPVSEEYLPRTPAAEGLIKRLTVNISPSAS
ncbi:MAG: sulfatase-like hydrolase/transferase [Gammaproteobacteria bacterium]|nr:sulfatase-like hydrolase/transferase [Gammaproteobacteria bacterium]